MDIFRLIVQYASNKKYLDQAGIVGICTASDEEYSKNVRRNIEINTLVFPRNRPNPSIFY